MWGLYVKLCLWLLRVLYWLSRPRAAPTPTLDIGSGRLAYLQDNSWDKVQVYQLVIPNLFFGCALGLGEMISVSSLLCSNSLAFVLFNRFCTLSTLSLALMDDVGITSGLMNPLDKILLLVPPPCALWVYVCPLITTLPFFSYDLFSSFILQ